MVSEVEFVWRPKASNDSCEHLKCFLTIPNNVELSELAFRLIKKNNFPFYVKNELHMALKSFVKKETSEFFNEIADSTMRPFRGIPNEELSELITASSNSIAIPYTKEYERFSELTASNPFKDQYEFSLLHHRLMHGGAQLQLVDREKRFSAEATALRSEMDKDFCTLTEKQNRELETSVEHEKNKLALVHVEERQAFETRWEKKSRDLQTEQKKAMHEWMIHAANGNFISPTPEYLTSEDDGTIEDTHHMSESFTIHLGSQLKMMHNLRLTCMDALGVCRERSPEKTIQTSLCLYSANLRGTVILVDNRVSSYKGIKRKFADICLSRCELHFPDIETQLSEIREEYRQAMNHSDSDSQTRERANNDDVMLNVGDVYITRHSNLGRAHVVFHLVAGSHEDDLLGKDINSRHQVIQGLRSILRIAYERDIRTLSLPLLLVNNIEEEISTAWCNKRADLVFKCVKGFMIEMASLGADVAQDPRTIEFLVPVGINESLFLTLISTLQEIFKMSSPLILKTSAT